MNEPVIIGLHLNIALEQSRRLIEGVLEYVAKHELGIREFNFLEDESNLPDLPPWLGKADGMVMSAARSQALIDWLPQGRAPIVNAATDMRDIFVSVFTDAHSLAKVAVEHFLELGLRNMAYVGYQGVEGSRDRCKAMADELARRKLRLKSYQTKRLFPATCVDIKSLDDVEPQLLRLIQRAKKPLALLAMNDSYAAAICRIVQWLGFAIPDDVAVIGVDDSVVARISSPAISSIRTAGERIGYEAARILHRIIRGERLARRNVKLPVLELVARESTVGKRRAGVTDMERALEFIRKKACEGIRIEDVAAHVHMSLRTFELQFASSAGHTVGEEVRRVRLARAKNLLETTDLPLPTVSRQVGFNDATYLNNFFRRWLGTTPAKYRREQRQ